MSKIEQFRKLLPPTGDNEYVNALFVLMKDRSPGSKEMRVQSAPKVESSSVSGTNQAAETSPKAKSLAENAWEQMTQQWQAVETKTTQAIKKLPPEAAQMYQLQLLANQLHLRSVLVSKVGETVASTIQKLQQMGAGS